MTTSTKSIEIKLERTIRAAPDEVFDAWLDPKTPGTPWNYADRLIINPVVDGLFYWCKAEDHAHYGRFTEFERPGRLQHTWVSPSTMGEESLVTVTFASAGAGTLMTLMHTGLPDNEEGRGHERGWYYFLGTFTGQFGKTSRKAQ